jgi:hypothetical protein
VVNFILDNWELLVKIYAGFCIVGLAVLASILTHRYFFSGNPVSKAKKHLVIAMWLACILDFLLISRRYYFTRIEVSEDFYVQQQPFVSRYDLRMRGGKLLVENVYEWKETDKFLYGSGRGERYFVYDKEKDEMTFFSSEHDFWTTAKSLGLKYGEGVCDTVEAYFYKNY